ncbi:MAG TPA: hypothetical protein VIO64_10670 [Pseudobacteroides sp.]|uniref:hypothetical protein n=1 Tax=Pseudobacteroides sp. TaxID=1968840 RepID=UPI002F93DA7E
MPIIMQVKTEGVESLIKDIRLMKNNGESSINDVVLAAANFTAPLLKEVIPRSNDDKHVRDKINVNLGKKKNKNVASASVVIGGEIDGYDNAFHWETGTKNASGSKKIRRKFDKSKNRIIDHMQVAFVSKAGGS